MEQLEPREPEANIVGCEAHDGELPYMVRSKEDEDIVSCLLCDCRAGAKHEYHKRAPFYSMWGIEATISRG